MYIFAEGGMCFLFSLNELYSRAIFFREEYFIIEYWLYFE